MSEETYQDEIRKYLDALMEKEENQEALADISSKGDEARRTMSEYMGISDSILNRTKKQEASSRAGEASNSYHSAMDGLHAKFMNELQNKEEFAQLFDSKTKSEEIARIVCEYSSQFDIGYLSDKYGKLPEGVEAKNWMTVAEYKALLEEAKEFKPQQKVQDESKDGADQGDPKPAENTEELGPEEIKLVDGKGEQLVDEDQDWVKRYEARMKQYAEENQQEWVREEKNEDGQPYEGLKGKIGEADYHFTAPDKAKSNLAGIDGVVALAQKEGLSLAYNEKWSDEFKAEVLKACEKYGVSIEGMPEQAKEKEEQKEEPTPTPVERPVVKEDYESTYSVDPKIAAAKMKGLYVRTDDADESKKATKVKALETEVKKQEELLAGRAYQVTGEEKATAELLMQKYVLAQRQGNQEMADTCALALQRYGVDKIERVPNSEEGMLKVTAKPYSERTDEEKAKINEALDKSLPKKQEQYNPEVFQQLAQAKAANTNS